MKEQHDRPISSRGTTSAGSGSASSSTLVVVGVGSEQSAIPLARVARLERFAAAQVEQTQGRSIVQYRGELLPLVDLAASLGQYSSNEGGDDVSVLVHTIGDRTVGIIVDNIIDITDSDIDQREASGYVLGTAVINQRVTTVIDTSSLLESMFAIEPVHESSYLDDHALAPLG